jgi:hypothetical protein
VLAPSLVVVVLPSREFWAPSAEYRSRGDRRFEIADAQKVKSLAPLACKTDRIDAWVLAELARRDLVPAIWLPDPLVRAERERARWRLRGL